MEKVLKSVKKPLILFFVIVGYILVWTTLYYNCLASLATIVKLNFIFWAILMFVLGFSKGKKASKQGYLEGLKIGAVAVCILFILNLVFYRTFSLSLIIYYIVFLLSPTIGSMIGINLHH